MMRIITGRARGVRLNTLSGDATRPTLERTKEAVFSMLQFALRDANVLDLFAGSGQLGLEAISRGARHAILCDASREAISVVRQNVQKTRFEAECDVVCMDYRAYLQAPRKGDRFDLVFLDPPYALGAVPVALRLLIDHDHLANGAKLVCETGAGEDVFCGDETLRESFDILRQTRYGAAYVTVLQFTKSSEGE